MRSLFFLPAAVLVIAATSCETKVKGTSTKKDILSDNLDTTVSPSEDFFQYANGGWIKKNSIPNDQAA